MERRQSATGEGNDGRSSHRDATQILVQAIKGVPFGVRRPWHAP
jgi:hypothetical protein